MRSFSAGLVPRPKFDFDFRPGLQYKQVDLEIGAGQGLFAIRHSQNHSDHLVLAIEQTNSRFAKLKNRKLNHPQLENLQVLQADAVAFVTHFIPLASLDHVYLHYPNPYPKSKQANLRWHNRPFFGHLMEKMKTGAQLTLATNVKSYAEEAELRITEHWKLQLLSKASLSQGDLEPRSHFEIKYLATGETCWNLIFQKVLPIKF